MFHSIYQAVVVNVDPTLKLVSIYKFSVDSRHFLDPVIKKVIMPTFTPLKPKKWFNDYSLFS
jgi:hypothetical protein